ncbi:TPA: cysteine desulfurase [Candidatus Woesearchaeota archaeon]|nr:cysteine desulfurase [Candidatus Woesearchaeota archaeon]HII69352.1 cysteine desulfurase [Candidatus Woesearchaeota archaeon]
MRGIYLDNGASTQVDIAVADEIRKYLIHDFGNASSNHAVGERACFGLERSRIAIAESLWARPEEMVFTSGGTESNNLALKGTAFANKAKGNHIITTKIEHDCVLNSCRWLERHGFRVTYLDIDKEGVVSAEQVRDAITDSTVLVSIIHGNNEIGTIQDIAAIAAVCRESGALFHTDACQSYSKVPLSVKKIPVDLVTINAHKIHGPKGVGALYVRKGTAIEEWQHGGGHEKGYRSGTENVAGIAGFAKAAELALAQGVAGITSLRDKLISGVLAISGSRLNGHPANRLANNVNVSFAGINGEELLAMLNGKGVYCSTGSACSAKKAEASHVLKAIGLDINRFPSTIRLTLSRFTTKEEIERAIAIITASVQELRSKGS